MSEARKIVARCVDITPDIARQLIEKLIEEKIDFVVAPYEADAQIAYLVRNGFAHYAISEDSDLILYGCEYVLYKLNAEGGGTLFQLASLPRSLADFHKGGFCFDTFKRMCILSGCDYLPNIPNVGLQKAKRFFASGQPTDMRKALPQLPNVLKMKKLTVSQEYIAKFIEAENTFRHQLVYCPRAKKMRPVTDYDENQNPDEMLYAGDYLPEPIDLHFAIGNVDFEKLSVIDESWLYNVRQSLFDNEKSIWNEAYQLEDKDALNKIWNRLTKSATVRPDFLDQIHNSAAKKPRIERSEVSEQVRKSLDKVQMDDQEVTFISQTSTHHEVTSLSNEKTTIYNESTQKNTQIVVRSRFFKNSNHTGNEDEIKKESIAKIASIFESRKKIKRKVELLYGSESDKISSQSSVDSGYDAKSSQSS